MKDSGVIDKEVFSFYIDMKKDKSKITLGGYSLDKFAYPGSLIKYF